MADPRKAPNKSAARARGRQFKVPRSEELAAKVCALIAEGYTLRQVARATGMASVSSITEWARADNAFAARYARAKEAQADHFAEEILAISDDGSNDWMTREGDAGEIVTVADHEHIQRSKLRVDARKWLMAKMMPKKYGDRVIQELTGKDGGPIETAALTTEERQARAKAIVDGAFGPAE